jgi:hypothetical protein
MVERKPAAFKADEARVWDVVDVAHRNPTSGIMNPP